MFLTLIAIIPIVLYFFIRNIYTYWDRYEIPSVKAQIPSGNFGALIRKEKSFGVIIYELYKNSTDSLLGIYLFFKPAILVRDPEVVKNILTRDFQHFHDRGVYVDEKNDPMSANLFAMTGENWKSLRNRLTPAFTSGKLKGMFSTIENVADGLVEHLKKPADNNYTIDIRDWSHRYVIDSIASTTFGLDGVSSLKEPNNDFRMMGIRLNDNKDFINGLRGAASFICPGLLKLLRMRGLPKFMADFCMDLVKTTVEGREKHNIERRDLMQLLIQLRNGQEVGENEWKISTNSATGKSTKTLSYEEIAAQVFIFYIAGSESTTSTISYTLYELSQNEELMERAINDVESTLDQHDGCFSYESIQNMKFIDLCVKETLRKYPVLPILNRECTKSYPVPGTKFTIQKGTSIIISLLGIHRDENLFPNPDKYNPDRFTDEKKAYTEDYYMPFGLGPRNCIAFRMGLMSAKVAIVKLLMNYRFKAERIKELEFDYVSPVLIPLPDECTLKISNKC